MSVFTPGRVNIIGEHIDYNGGRVLPTALPLGVTVSASPRDDGNIRVESEQFEDAALRDLGSGATGHWSDYAVGSVVLANRAGLYSGGVDLALSSTLPFGSGISSSAAVCVGVLKALRELSGAEMDDTGVAVLARRVENDFIGMPCGIMDQMAVSIARPGQALSLDTNSLDYDLIKLPESHRICVVHSGVTRQLNEGRYKERKEECDAVKALAGRDDICRMSDAELEALQDLPEPLFRRARHCVTEHRRTVEASDALRAGDFATLGRLMVESHASMRDDFEITVPAIDALVETAVALGADGSRMTGGGFGGCIVAAVEADKVEGWTDKLISSHPQARFVC